MTHSQQPLTVEVAPDPLVLERLVSKRQTQLVLERGSNGNGGHGNGGNGGNGHGNGGHTPGIPASSWLGNGPRMTSNPWSQADPSQPAAKAGEEQTKELDFAPAIEAQGAPQTAGQQATQPNQQAPGQTAATSPASAQLPGQVGMAQTQPLMQPQLQQGQGAVAFPGAAVQAGLAFAVPSNPTKLVEGTAQPTLVQDPNQATGAQPPQSGGLPFQTSVPLTPGSQMLSVQTGASPVPLQSAPPVASTMTVSGSQPAPAGLSGQPESAGQAVTGQGGSALLPVTVACQTNLPGASPLVPLPDGQTGMTVSPQTMVPAAAAGFFGQAAPNAGAFPLVAPNQNAVPGQSDQASATEPAKADFFSTPPQLTPDRAAPPKVDVSAAVNVTIGTSFDFFNKPNQPAQNQSATPATAEAGSASAPSTVPQAQGAPGAQADNSDYQLGDRSDFFASPQQQPKGAPQVVPTNAANLSPDMAPPVSPAKGTADAQVNLGLPPSAEGTAERAASEPPQEGKNTGENKEESVKEKQAVSQTHSNAAAQAVMDFFSSSSFKPAQSASEAQTPAPSSSPRASGTFSIGKGQEQLPEAMVDDEEEIKPKIARPRGYTPKDGGKSKDDEDDDSDDSADAIARGTVGKSPSRRSFSGNTVKKESAEEEEGDSEKSSGFLNSEVSFLGMAMTRQNQLMLIGIFGFIGLVMLNVVMSLFRTTPGGTMGGAPAPVERLSPQGGPMRVAGTWSLRVLEGDGKAAKGGMLLQQKGLDIGGRGADDYGRFVVKGSLQPPALMEFTKSYLMSDGSQGKPVTYQGRISIGTNPLYVSGNWHMKKRVGMSWRAQIVDYQGQWEGTLLEPVAPEQPAQTTAIPVPITDSVPNPFKWFEKMPMEQRFLCAAIVLLGGAGGVVMLSFVIFGPNGKINIWSKQKYIPSQYNAQHGKMLRELSKPARAGSLPLGQRCEWKPWTFWAPRNLALPPEIRKKDPHLLLLGAGDKGKTRLMAHMVAHDIESADRAVVVIDSDGGLSDLIVRWISHHQRAKEFAKRVILLDPTRKGQALGYNPLEMPEDEDLQSAASSLVYGFKAIYTEPPGAQSQWNQQTANILRNAALLLMANGKTLTDLPTLLNDNDFRDVLLEAVEKKKRERAEYITLLDTWGQYKRLARTDQWINWVEPILNRVGPMLSDARIRSILTKPVGDIKLKKLIEEKKILIVKVPKGQLDQNANLLGSLIVTGVKQAALSLANEHSPKQNPVALYLDEFDNFIEKDTIETITQESDKFQIGFIGCIKTLQHLPQDFQQQLVIAFGTLACFALAKKDGDLLGPQMFRVDGRKIKHQTIQNFFNKVNTSPQFELISDEEKLNIDRVVGQEARTFFCYRVGTVAGVFRMRSHDFNDIPDNQVNKKLIDKMYKNSQTPAERKEEKEPA